MDSLNLLSDLPTGRFICRKASQSHDIIKQLPDIIRIFTLQGLQAVPECVLTITVNSTSVHKQCGTQTNATVTVNCTSVRKPCGTQTDATVAVNSTSVRKLCGIQTDAAIIVNPTSVRKLCGMQTDAKIIVNSTSVHKPFNQSQFTHHPPKLS